MIKSWIEKGRKIKSRGIALTHRDQGYSANNRHISLLTKSDIDPDKLTPEIIKSLEQVQLKISMEEFLRRFFDMWSDDAELLTKVLGMKTEFEQESEDLSPKAEWELKWNKKHQEYIEDQLSSITLINKAREGSDLSLHEQFELIKTRKEFEDGCQELGLDFGNNLNITPSAPVVKASSKISSEGPSGVSTGSSSGAPAKTTKETPVDKEIDVTKSAEFIEMQKALQAQTELLKSMQAQVADAQEIIKAQKAAKRAVAIEKASGFPFVAAEHVESVADLIENPEKSSIVAVLEKAASFLKEKEDLLAAKNAEIEEVKKSFADGKEVGADGTLTDVAKGVDDAQARLDRIIEAKAQLKKSTSPAEYINA